MKRLILVLIAAAIMASTAIVLTATLARTFESMTIAGTAAGFQTATLAIRTRPNPGEVIETCVGKVETAEMRFRIDGTNPTSSTGFLAAVGETVTITGHTNLTNAKFIRTTGTSAKVDWTCSSLDAAAAPVAAVIPGR